MARLLGVNYPTTRLTIELRLDPTNDIAVDANIYVLEIQLCHQIYVSTFSVASWQTEHDDAWIMAKAFKNLEQRARQEQQIRALMGDDYLHNALYTSFGPIHFVVWNRRNPEVVGHIFIQETEDQSIFRKFHFIANLHDAVQFGYDLEKEVVQAAPAWASQYDSIKNKYL